MELVLATVFASAHVSLFEDVKPLMRKGAFKRLDFALEGGQAETLISAQFGQHKTFSAV